MPVNRTISAALSVHICSHSAVSQCEVCQAPWDQKAIAQAQRQAGHRTLLTQPKLLISTCSRRLLVLVDVSVMMGSPLLVLAGVSRRQQRAECA